MNSPVTISLPNGPLLAHLQGNQLCSQVSDWLRLALSSGDKEVPEGQDEDVAGGIPGGDAMLTVKAVVKLEINRSLYLVGLSGWQSLCKVHLNPNS